MKKLFRTAALFIAAVMLLGCLTSLLAGCHGGRGLDAFVMPEAFDDSQNYEIVFWAKNDTNITQRRIYESAIASFEALYPNVTVKMKSYTDYGTIYNDVITNISTQTTPNVCITYPDHIATYITGENVVVPLEGLISDPRYGLGGSEVRFESVKKEEVVPKFLDECDVAGQCYALPFMRSTEALYINKTYVEAMGYTIPDVVTWDYIWEVSEKAMEKTAADPEVFKVNGQKIMIPFIYKSTDNMMITMLKQKNAGYSDADGNILIFNDTTRDILKEIAVHAGTRAFSTFKVSSYPGNYFNAGRCIFAIDSTAGATWIGSHAPLSEIHESELVEFETVVRPLPQFDTENPKMISQGPSVCVFNKKDPGEVLASWLFAQFLITNDVQIPYSETEGYVPVTEKAQKDPAYLKYLESRDELSKDFYSVKIDASKMLLDNIGNSFITPVFNGSTSLRDTAGELIESVVKSRRKNETVDDEYLDKLEVTVTKLYRLDQISMSPSGRRAELGPLPAGSLALLIVLACVWLLLGAYFITDKIIERRKKLQSGA